MKENKVAFLAIIKSVAIKSLVSGDKSMRITLDVDSPTQEIVAAVNQVHQADKEVAVALAEVSENNKKP